MDNFSTTSPNLQIAWDATTLADFRRCPRFYQYRHIDCWRAKEETDDITFGKIFHEAGEKFDHARALGHSFEESLRIALRYVLTTTGRRDESGTFHPWKTDNNIKNRFTLIRSIVWYLLQFEHDVFETARLPDGRPAVELSFRFELPLISPEGKPYILCGHLDRVVKDGEYHQYLDRKTTKSSLTMNYFRRYSPDTQMSCYSVAVRVMFGTPSVRGLIDAAQVAVNFSRFARGSTGRTQGQMDEWIRDTIYWIKQAEECAKTGYWPQNDQSCNLYGGCKYRPICGMDPAPRQNFLQGTFVKGERWNPLELRGE